MSLPIKHELRALASAYGFQSIAFGQVGPTPFMDAYEGWVKAGLHADMGYLETGLDVRADPRQRLASARSVMVLAMDYGQPRPPDPGGLTGMVATYAWGRDYHNLIGKRLKKLRKSLREQGIQSWGGVDTAPIIERSWAHATGLAFQGKSCVNFVPGKTSYLFLAVLFLDIAIEPDIPRFRDHCGKCTRCLDQCPTDAFVGPRVLDSRKCIAYWTIEARDLAPEPLLSQHGRWFFGCDVCQEVCPHNRQQQDEVEADFSPRNAWIDCEELLRTSDADVMDRFIGTPLRRPKAKGLKRNAAVVLGNLADPSALPALYDSGLTHPEAVVRRASEWAIQRILSASS